MKILAIFAHPDDESIIVGGTAAKALNLGHEVYFICATRGEASTAYDREYCSQEELPSFREKEYRRACEILGVTEGILLDYRDGTLSGIPEAEGVNTVMEAVKRIRPDVIITFEPEGISFHPDHKTIHRWVMQALKDPWFDTHATDFYWVTVKQNPARMRNDRMMGHPADAITSCVMIEPWKAQKRDAILAHRTQWNLFQRSGLVVDGELGRNHDYEYFIKVDRDGKTEVEAGSDLFDVFWA